MPRNVFEETVHILANAGIKHIFGITGDALNPFTDALRRDGRMQWYTVRHEETAAFAASAQAELTGELAVCAGTVGPGAIHLINGLYNAKRDNAPVLAITGYVPREDTGFGYFQEADMAKLFDDVCVFNQTLRSEAQMPRLLQQAMQTAISKRGVANISIPVDLAVAKVPANKFAHELIKPKTKLLPNLFEIKEAAEMINKSKDVALLIGSGCRGHKEQVLAMAEKLNAPIVHALKASEVIEFDNPYRIGGIGHLGTPQGLHVLDNNKCLIMLGTDFPYSAFLPAHKNIIQIDYNAVNLGKRCGIKLGLLGDVGTTLELLTPHCEPKSDNKLLKQAQAIRTKWNRKMDKKASLDGKKQIPPQAVVRMAGEMARDDALFVGEVGEVTVWIARYLQMRGEQRLIGSFNHGSLGVGLPAAIGAQALNKKRQVIALCGDGAFGMLLADFVTASRYDLPIKVIVLNNAKFGFVELEMEASGLPRFATDLVNPDFAKVAEACGGVGLKVSKPNQLEGAMKKLFAAKKPALLEVMVNPGEIITPAKIELKTAWRYTSGKVKELLLEKDFKGLFQ